MEPSWHKSGIKNRCQLRKAFFHETRSRCSGGWFCRIKRVEVGSKHGQKIDQKMGSTRKGILASIFYLHHGPSGRHLGPIWAHLGPSWCHLGAMFALLGPILAASWPILGLSWPILAPSWPNLGPSWLHLGAVLVHLARFWHHLNLILARLSLILEGKLLADTLAEPLAGNSSSKLFHLVFFL